MNLKLFEILRRSDASLRIFCHARDILTTQAQKTAPFRSGSRVQRLPNPRNEESSMWDKLALILLVIGGINWGLVGIFELDLVAWMFGGAASVVSRLIYILVALSAVWCISFLFRDSTPVRSEA